jgi:hypothetical protein
MSFFVKGIIIPPGFKLIDAHNHFIVEFDCLTFTNNGSQRAATKIDQRKIKKNSEYAYASLLLYMSSATLVIDSPCNHLQRAAFNDHRIPLLLFEDVGPQIYPMHILENSTNSF